MVIPTKIIEVPIIDDLTPEGDETFTVSMSNPSNAAIGTFGTATVTISANDSSAGVLQLTRSQPWWARLMIL